MEQPYLRLPGFLRRWLYRRGIKAVVCNGRGYDLDFADHEMDLVDDVRPYTLTSPERIRALQHSIEYLVRCDIPGAIVECGVWRGGSMMAAAKTLLGLGVTDRDLYLFDTFQGMPPATERDVDRYNRSGQKEYLRTRREDGGSDFTRASLQEVQHNMASTGYPTERIHYVRGKVEDTLPDAAPDELALLRLDTDWYESTQAEMVYLYPRLSSGGVLILDDYACWRGAREAVDEYIEQNDLRLLLCRIDRSARLAVKP